MKDAVIVTGGGRGLGRVIAMTLAADYNILITGRTESDLKDTCEIVRGHGGTIEYLVNDVREPTSGDIAMGAIHELGWNLTSLVYNAGVGKSGQTHEFGADAWNDIIDTNLNGAFYFAKAVLPHLVDQKRGTLCFIGSVAGLSAYPYDAAYVASKHGLVGFTKSIDLEYAKHSIRSFVMCPGFIQGEMTERTIHSVMERRGISYEDAKARVERSGPILDPVLIAERIKEVCDGHYNEQTDSVITFENTHESK